MLRCRTLILRLLLLTAILLPVRGMAKEPGIAIQFDPNTPNAPIWLGYLMARAAYRMEHKLPLPESGTIFSTFDEEVEARTSAAQIYLELKEKDRGLHDSYWETLSQVKSKGFMKSYVWTHLHHPTWSASQQPKDLSAFHAWSQSHLKNHKPLTHGGLAVEKN